MINIGFIYAIGAAITWGLVYAIDQKILYTVSPITLLFINSVLGAVIILPLIFWGNNSIKILLGSGKLNISLIILSVVLATLANFLIFSSIKSLGSSTASIIEIAYPFFVILFAFIFFKSSPNIWFYVGGILIFLGSAIIVWRT